MRAELERELALLMGWLVQDVGTTGELWGDELAHLHRIADHMVGSWGETWVRDGAVSVGLERRRDPDSKKKPSLLPFGLARYSRSPGAPQPTVGRVSIRNRPTAQQLLRYCRAVAGYVESVQERGRELPGEVAESLASLRRLVDRASSVRSLGGEVW